MHILSSGVILTLKSHKLLMETALHVLLQLAQRGRLQHLEVDFYLFGVGLAHGGLQCLDDLHHPAQLLARQTVNVQAQLVLLLVRQWETFVRIPGLYLLPRIPEIQNRAVQMCKAEVKADALQVCEPLLPGVRRGTASALPPGVVLRILILSFIHRDFRGSSEVIRFSFILEEVQMNQRQCLKCCMLTQPTSSLRFC